MRDLPPLAVVLGWLNSTHWISEFYISPEEMVENSIQLSLDCLRGGLYEITWPYRRDQFKSALEIPRNDK
jgi:hypothetical protein